MTFSRFHVTSPFKAFPILAARNAELTPIEETLADLGRLRLDLRSKLRIEFIDFGITTSLG
jgi:hypothetical protein